MRTILSIVVLVVVIVLSAPSEGDSSYPNASAFESGANSKLATVGQWKRYEIAFTNTSWQGNPFDLELKGMFTHLPSGRQVTQLGFYAGNDTWKLFFMPDAIGEWTFTTVSSDPELNAKTGAFRSVESTLPGRLVGKGNRWQLEDSDAYVAPIMLPSRQWLKATETTDGIDEFIAWADETAGALIIGTTLVYFEHEQDAVPYIKGKEGEWFNITMWDRLNSHYDMLRDRGMGFYIMFYSDDSESPNRWGIKEKSPEELRLFRYAIARFAAYPIVMWDTGIDIGETRSTEWINWFADWFNANDPWQHPVGSRSGGGSGGHHPQNGTFYSDGASTLPSHQTVVEDWTNCALPRAYTDRWREDYTRGNFNRERIRRAAWEVGLVGGSAVYVSGNDNGGYLTETYATDFKAAPDLGHRNRFFKEQIGWFGSLSPHAELISAGDGTVLVADPGREYVAYDWDGGQIGIDLSNVSTSFNVSWYNPRTGQLSPQGTVTGGSIHTFFPPFSGDVVLHLYRPEDTSYRHFLPLITENGNKTATTECDGITTNENLLVPGTAKWLTRVPVIIKAVSAVSAFSMGVLLVIMLMISVAAVRLYHKG